MLAGLWLVGAPSAVHAIASASELDHSQSLAAPNGSGDLPWPKKAQPRVNCLAAGSPRNPAAILPVISNKLS